MHIIIIIGKRCVSSLHGVYSIFFFVVLTQPTTRTYVFTWREAIGTQVPI